MYASKKGHCDIARALCKNGAEIDMQDVNGTSALIYASKEGHCDVVQLLLDKGAGVDLQDEDAWVVSYI